MKTKKKILLSIISIILLVFLNGIYFVFFGQHKAAKKLMTGEDLTLYECISTYIMHIGVWMFGWPLSPEAAKEAFKAHFPQENNVYFVRQGFRSKKLHNSIEALSNKPVGTSIKISWNAKDAYKIGSGELRAGLALNACNVKKIDESLYEISCPIIYPNSFMAQIGFKEIPIPINEGIFRHLQDRGWLSKYTAVYMVSTE